MKGVPANIVSALAALVGLAQANSDIVSLYTSGNTYITEASATLVLPKLPSPVSGDVAIWSAIMMENEASFLQGVTSNSPSGSYCNDQGKNWCNFAYTLVDKLNSSTQLWDQNVYIDGELLSSVSTSKGQHGDIFYISIECASGGCAQHPAHSWQDVSVVLNQADQRFKHSGSWNFGATGGAMSTPDGGKTWTLTTLNIPAQKAE
ncbi:hypothetical protein KVR01_008505 [Diaporthe batatas]|uniref:uncharacterized protein n=1 Tax=Diaporthe batatas TaxID=748121 RepID=UPI001D050FD4|nr:uncharacterized protein KVR01_008505 [Diaporthe batatas]KAG8161518.1 hypothetical protein KVR01_008505 [Diaporthe batatas]